MTRFAWLQSRNQSAVAVAALLILAVIAIVTGPHLVHLYQTDVVKCSANGTCQTAKDTFLKNDKAMRDWFGILLIVVPGIIGLFWGAPLVARELETGTHRLVWTQSVTRTRWLAVKLAVVGLAGMAVAGLMSLTLTWWASPFDTVNANRFSPTMFDQRGVVVVGYTAFAFVLGVTAGVLIRRAVPAMATTLVLFVATRLAVIHWLRPHLIAPAHRVSALDPVSTGFGSSNGGATSLFPAPPKITNAWILSTRIVDHAGRGLTHAALAHACPHLGLGRPVAGPSGGPDRAQAPLGKQSALPDCVAKVATKYHLVTTYQPADRYWAFQWYELAIFIAAALILSGMCFWFVRRRLA
jgi:hypothetical protein